MKVIFLCQKNDFLISNLVSNVYTYTQKYIFVSVSFDAV